MTEAKPDQESEISSQAAVPTKEATPKKSAQLPDDDGGTLEEFMAFLPGMFEQQQ